jgi:hypothetical protein
MSARASTGRSNLLPIIFALDIYDKYLKSESNSANQSNCLKKKMYLMIIEKGTNDVCINKT